MKRTGEIVLAIIAGVINFLALISGVRSVSLNPSALEQQLSAAGSNLSSQDVTNIVHLLHLVGTILVVFSVISLILMIGSLILLKRGSGTKLGGWLLILAGVTSIMEVVPAVLYVIAGIMTLARKPKSNFSNAGI
ncbi:DUF4064 domain-containing protein [Sporolactobacillus shoreae]|uniref:DUF4064 domain-containing protein n=1 Tax=Sporolactobacillus shoreae TaxID=1465501 RepID=A0A4Z0GKR7_9BACL|nr:DUF4064 domain-containing protein [Sporolactobacillus shoreae]TGA96191.1 DUF4064 domain-containing protein [Sporolactobacillus shoreae]